MAESLPQRLFGDHSFEDQHAHVALADDAVDGTVDDACSRFIAVRADVEARPEEVTRDDALGWVPFAAGRARQVVFLRLARARAMVGAMRPGFRHDGLTSLLVAKLLGRTLAHELGHVLLDSRRHATRGLMRPGYCARDILAEPVASYTLDADERAALVAGARPVSQLARR